MALAFAPMTHTTITVAVPGVSVGPATAVPDNCHTILITNPDLVNAAFVTVGTPGGALTAATAKRIPAGLELSLPLGDRYLRGIMDQGTVAGSGLIGDAAAAMVLEVTYLNYIGASDAAGSR